MKRHIEYLKRPGVEAHPFIKDEAMRLIKDMLTEADQGNVTINQYENSCFFTNHLNSIHCL